MLRDIVAEDSDPLVSLDLASACFNPGSQKGRSSENLFRPVFGI